MPRPGDGHVDPTRRGRARAAPTNQDGQTTARGERRGRAARGRTPPDRAPASRSPPWRGARDGSRGTRCGRCSTATASPQHRPRVPRPPRPAGAAALRIAFADGRREELDLRRARRRSARFAHLLEARGHRGRRAGGDHARAVASPSTRPCSASSSAAPSPCRCTRSSGRTALRAGSTTAARAAPGRVDGGRGRPASRRAGAAPRPSWARLAHESRRVTPDTARRRPRRPPVHVGHHAPLPEAVRHDHRSMVTLVRAALFALGPRARATATSARPRPPGGTACGTARSRRWRWASRSAPTRAASPSSGSSRLCATFAITNLAAAPTVYRHAARARAWRAATVRPQKASYTGEELDAAHLDVRARCGLRRCGMYGTTEIGVLLANYPGFPDYDAAPGALGQAAARAGRSPSLDADGQPLPPGQHRARSASGAARMVPREGPRLGGRGRLLPLRGPRRRRDHLGRLDHQPARDRGHAAAHPDVREAAVVGVPDALRGRSSRRSWSRRGATPTFAASCRSSSASA